MDHERERSVSNSQQRARERRKSKTEKFKKFEYQKDESNLIKNNLGEILKGDN